MPFSNFPVADAAGVDPLIPLNKVPELRHVSPPTRWRWAMTPGGLECVRIGRRLYTTASAVRRFLDAGRARAVPPPLPPPLPRSRQAERSAATAAVRSRLGLAAAD